MNEIQKNVIVILGMHRSGSSLLAGCLQLLGVKFNKQFIYPDTARHSEQFDNFEITLIHDMLLRDLGCRWDMIGNLPDGWLDSEAAQMAEQKLMSIIGRELVDTGLWSVRDPRICRLMPLWHRVLNRMEIHSQYIVLARHPFEVARSLQDRNQSDLLKGHLLWMTHYRDALNACMDHPHVMVTYDQLLADPLTTLQRISRILNIPYPRDIEDCYPSIVDYVRPELKHHHYGNYPEAKGFSQYDWIYQQFRLAQVQAIDYHPLNSTDVNAVNFPDRNLSSVQLSVFPLVSSSVRTLSDFKFERNHATAMFNNLLGIIGRYERSDISDVVRRERALVAASQSGAAILLFSQLYLPTFEDGKTTYSETNSQKFLLVPDEWQNVSVEISRSDILKSGRLRFDPLNTMGMVAFSSIKLLNSATNQVVWKTDASDSFGKCVVQGDAFSISNHEVMELVVSGSSSHVILPEIADLPDCPILLDIWLKVEPNLASLQNKWFDTVNASLGKTRKLSELTGEFSLLMEEKSRLELEGTELRGELSVRVKELESRGVEIEELRRTMQMEVDRKETELAGMREEKSRLELEGTELRGELSARVHELESRGVEIEELRRATQMELERKEAELQGLREEKSLLELEMQSFRQDLEQKLYKQESLTREYYKELMSAEKYHSQLQERIDNLQNLAEERMHLIGNLGKQMQENSDINDQLLNSVKKDWANDVERFSQEMEQMQRQKETQLRIIMQERDSLKQNEQQIQTELHRNEQQFQAERQQNELIRKQQETQIQTLDSELENMRSQRKREMEKEWLEHAYYLSNHQLCKWLAQIENDYWYLKNSLRWKTGYFFARMIELFLFWKKKPMPTENLERLFHDRRSWLPKYGNGNQDQQFLIALIQQSKNDVDALLKSGRWRIGNGIVSFVDRLLFRGKLPMATDHILMIFDEYARWADSENDSSRIVQN